MTGNYHDIGAFASDIGQLSRIVTLNDIALNVGKDGTLTMDATAKTFRYLDEDEVADAARGGQGGQGGEGQEMKRAPLIAARGRAARSPPAAASEQQELRAELAGHDQGHARQGRPPLPDVKPYEPVPYNAFDLPDPFGPAKIELPTERHRSGTGSGLQPDLNRPKEPLEAYPLESLKMVGHARAQTSRPSGPASRRTPACTGSASATTWARTSASSRRSRDSRDHAQGTDPGHQRRLGERTSTLQLQEADGERQMMFRPYEPTSTCGALRGRRVAAAFASRRPRLRPQNAIEAFNVATAGRHR